MSQQLHIADRTSLEEQITKVGRLSCVGVDLLSIDAPIVLGTSL